MTLILGPAAAAALFGGIAYWLLSKLPWPAGVIIGLTLLVAFLAYGAAPLIRIGG